MNFDEYLISDEKNLSNYFYQNIMECFNKHKYTCKKYILLCIRTMNILSHLSVDMSLADVQKLIIFLRLFLSNPYKFYFIILFYYEKK